MAQLDWPGGPLRLLSCPSRTTAQPHPFCADGVVQEPPSWCSQHGPTTTPRLTGPDRIPMRPAYYPKTGLDRPDKCCAASGRARASEEMRRGQPPSSRTRGSLCSSLLVRSSSIDGTAATLMHHALSPRQGTWFVSRAARVGWPDPPEEHSKNSRCGKAGHHASSHCYQWCYCRALLQAEVSHSVTAIHSFPASSSEERHRRPTPRRG